jgi:hypothetical protein
VDIAVVVTITMMIAMIIAMTIMVTDATVVIMAAIAVVIMAAIAVVIMAAIAVVINNRYQPSRSQQLRKRVLTSIENTRSSGAIMTLEEKIVVL